MEPRKRRSEGSTRSQDGEDQGAAADQAARVDAAAERSSETAVSLPGSESSARLQVLPAREPGDLGGASPRMVRGGQAREGGEPQAVGARAPKPQASEESDALVVPEKSANAWVTPAESMEVRGAAEGKLAQRNAFRTQRRQDAPTHLERVGERASKQTGEKFTNLLSHIRVPLLMEAYERLRKRAAPGVDGETWSSYGVDLDARLLDLEERVHRGNYHPLPVRRVHIPKGDGRTRPLGIPAVEDKILQQAVRMLLEPIYENEFLGFSYGFRPGRSPHAALDALYVALLRKVNWVLDADIRSFFDTIDHGWLKQFVEHRIGDKRLVRLLMKWLHAGVMEEEQLHAVEAGTPQGGIVSPLLANIYLHYVLDLWVRQWRRRYARGQVYVVRYADDFVMGFQDERDARAMREALTTRLAKFGLELHPDKTRVLRFGRFAHQHCAEDGRRRPETFDFLGFTHICAKAPDGSFRLARRTSRRKRIAKLGVLREELRRRQHDPVPEQHRWLLAVLRGHANYYGVPGNSKALASFRHQVKQAWHRRLQRRSQRARWTVEQHQRFELCFPLPTPRLCHPRPQDRFYVRRSRP
jgi:RNA-directed DNA polymerase